MITKEVIEEFISKNEFELCSTHNLLCIPIINRIYLKMKAGIKFSEIKVEEKLICNGHHRYIASLLAEYDISRIVSRSTSATFITEWKSVAFTEEDWDTAAEIEKFNQDDANFNNMTIEQIREILK